MSGHRSKNRGLFSFNSGRPELRVNPATVRLWVSKGQLKASRAGVRKWIVRRSELQRMLAGKIMSRLEYRYDASNQNVFPDNNGPPKSDQSTLTLGLILMLILILTWTSRSSQTPAQPWKSGA